VLTCGRLNLGRLAIREPLICAPTGCQDRRLHTMRAFTHKAG
jgi:hypothetical protein